VLFFGVGLVVARGRWRPGAVLGWTSLLATGALIVLILLSPYRGVIMDGVNPDAPLHVWNVPICALLALVLAPWALYTTQQKGSSLDPMFADLSYIVYLLHFPVLDVFNNGGGVSLRHLVEVSETFVITMVGSVLIWRYVDRPLNRLRTRWVAARLVPDARSRRVGEALA
jgi:peptidoglycan/LPS O-acetylase OafA/YrhL